MAAEDLGDLQAEILQVKHAIRSDTPCPVHGCEAAANRGRDLERRCLESGRDPRIPTHTRTRGHSTDPGCVHERIFLSKVTCGSGVVYTPGCVRACTTDRGPGRTHTSKRTSGHRKQKS